MEREDILKKIKSYHNDSVEKCRDIKILIEKDVNINPIEAIKWCLEGINICKKINYEIGVASFTDWLGIKNVYAGDYFEALKYFNNALNIYADVLKKENDEKTVESIKDSLSKVKNNIAIVYDNLGLLEEALVIQMHNLEYYKEKKQHKDAILALLNISSIYHNKKEYANSLKTLDAFFEYYKCHTLNEPISLGMAYVNECAAKYYHNTVEGKSILGYLKALDIFVSEKHHRFERMVCINLANHYENIKDFSLMEKYAIRAIDINNITGLNEMQDVLCNTLSKYYHQIGKSELAYKYLQEANTSATNKKKEAALVSIKKEEIQKLLKAISINDSALVFPETAVVKVTNGAKEIFVDVLKIAIVEINTKDDFARIISYDTQEVQLTTMGFDDLMKRIEETNSGYNFFRTNKRNSAINKMYRKEFNRKNKTITIGLKSSLVVVSFSIPQYYDYLNTVYKKEKNQSSH